MKTQASTVVIVMAVGAFVFATADALRASPVARTTSIAYADGAAPGFSGGFGESSCDACHFEAAVNTPPGQVTLTGIPERFAPGTAYPITVTLSRPGMMIGGFQLAARFEKGGAQAGTLAAGPGEEKRIKMEPGAIQYANQRLAGTALTGPGSVKWVVVWTAPPATGAVVFHVAANAANNDEAARGDYVYTAVATSQPQ
ncbi:MAG TPA: choice-of-anchor V domain-containing protein [Vicinamibacterales bacterium]|jgi:hypothetical protein|nr:choice-of-anchor V domain-containing protein [Vicinamibacterales bacterium]